PTNNNRATEVQAVINFYKADQDELNAGSIAAESIVASQTITVPLIKSYNDEDLKPRVSAHSQNTTTIIDSGQITDKSQPWAGVSIREAVASNALIYDGWRVNQYKGDYFGGRYIYFDVVDKDGNKLDDAKITDISVSGISNISTKWDWNANAFDAAGDTSNDSFQLNRDYSLQAGLHNHDWALFNMRDAEDSNNTFDQSKLAEVSLSFKITSQANYEGDVYVKVSDNTMGTWYENTYYNGNQFVLGEHVVYVGKAEKPAVVEVKDVNVDSTYKTIKIPEITITERVPGEFLSGSYDTTRTATGKDQRSIQIIVTEHGTGAPSPFVYFGSLANVKVEVVNSDSTTLELGKEKLDEPWNYNYMKSSGWSNYGGYITASALDIPVNKSSNAAMNTKKEKATIKISGLTIISDRAAVDGRYDIIVGGSAVADNYAQDDLDYGLAGLSNSLTKYPLPGGRLDTSPSTPSNPNPGNYGFYTEYRTYDKDLATFVTNTAGEGKFDTFGVIQELIDVNKAPITTDNNGGALAPTSHELILNVDTGSYTLDGAEGTMEMLPISEQGTTFAPFRAIGELLGFEVVWDGTDKIATLIDPVTNNAASFQIGSAEVTVTRGGTTFKRTMLNSAGEGYKTELKVPAGSQFGSTYIPLSQIAYAFGYDTENSSYSAETGLYTLAPKK
ncbi:MAG: copper amine oxidase N-terminal domain-containing protein, partial [Clostridiales bacterium]|nr:copper amine oxidase N-terminal domain-containing protein [Clostridiales bacterium]